VGVEVPEQLEGVNISFQVFDHFDVVEDIRANDGSGKNIYDIVDPYLRTVVALSVLFIIIHDLSFFNLDALSNAVKSKNVLTRKEKNVLSRPIMGDDKGRDASDRRRVIAGRGIRNDRVGARGVVHDTLGSRYKGS